MSWLPSNYSLNSIKDQFTNLAGELLNEIRDEKDDFVGEQATSNSNLLNRAEDAVSPSRFESKNISDLKSQIQCLENEKKDLISTLEQLDIDNQQNVEKIIKYKDNLQADLQQGQINFANLKQEYEKLKEWSGSPEVDAENEDLIKRNNDLVQEVFLLKKNCERSKLESHKLFQDNKLLQNQIDTNDQLLQDDMISQHDYKKLESILQEYEKRVRNYETELQELQKSNTNAMDDKKLESQSLQNIVESSNKIIASKDATIKELQENNLELESNLQSCEANIKFIEDVKIETCYKYDKIIVNFEEDILKLSSKNLMLTKQFETSAKELKVLEDVQNRNQELDNKILDLENQIEKLEADKNIADIKMSSQEAELSEQRKLLQGLQEENLNLTHVQKDCTSFIQSIYTVYCDPLDGLCDFKELRDVKPKQNVIINFFTELKSSQSKLLNEISELSDKNQKSILEIGKLTRNSSTLKQEIVNKNIEFEEFEAEYNELLKSNELMLAELNSLKSINLITISEANEDNMLQLETDLENANSKIKELEVILDSEKSRPQSSEPFEMLQKSFEMVNVENQDLQKALDKYKLDYENLDYKSNEQKAQMDSLQEDLLNYDKQKISLEEENNILACKLQELGDAYKKIYDDFIEQKSQSLQDIKSMREKLQSAKMSETSLKLQNDLQSKEIGELKKNTIATDLQQKLDIEKMKSIEIRTTLGKVIGELGSEINVLKEQAQKKNETMELSEVSLADQQNDQELENLRDMCNHQTKEIEDEKEKNDVLEKQLDSLNSNRQELIAALNAKHEESLNYYQQLQNLQKHLLVEAEKCKAYELDIRKSKVNDENNDAIRNQIEKLNDRNDFLKDKCDKMTETLMHEQSSSKKQLMDANEREQSLAKELERLRQHLLEIEEMYTKELLTAEQKTSEMQSKVNEVEQREKNSNNVYTSVSIRANQQVETLQTQLQLVTHQRDEIRNKLSDNEDQINKQAAALMNLQCVLQQFQKDKQKDIHNETDRIRRQIAAEKTAQDDLHNEISNLKQQLQESKEGLQAAARLTDQLEEANKKSLNMNNELTKLRAQLNETEKKYEDAMSQPDAKVDKTLLRNLVIGFISSNNNLNKDQHQILKIIGTVLDFSQQDNDKVQMNRSLQNSWINSLLHPAQQNMSQESLSLAFVKFLENESKPKNLPSLLDNKNTDDSSPKSVIQILSNQKTALMNEMVLPIFNDYSQRSSSSILKDVLKENH